MTRQLVDLARAHCDGRIVAIQEGGYSIDHTPLCVLATVEALGELTPSFDTDPIELDVTDAMRPLEREVIRGLQQRRP